jgi:GxxExxY protein
MVTEGGGLIFPKESYDLVGCAYEVFNAMRYGHHERNYQRAYAIELGLKDYKFVRELKVSVNYRNNIIGHYFLDFLVDNKIVVELKVGNEFHGNYIKQVLTYLKATNRKLGIIFLFTPTGLFYRRIVN